MAKDKVCVCGGGGGREALEEAKRTAAWSSQEEAAARGEMLRVRGREPFWHMGSRASRADTMEGKAESTGRHYDLQ